MIDTIIEFLIYITFRKRKRREEWHGVCEEKKVKGGYSFGKYQHSVVFRTDEGKKIKMNMSEEIFNTYERRKRYHKRSGEDFPDPES